MPQFLLRMLIAIVLLTVEVVLATAFVVNFTKPVENLKTWFQKHYRVTLAVVFPVLLVTNVGLTFLFSDDAANGSAEATVQERNPDFESEYLDSLFDPERLDNERSSADESRSPAPIRGYAADQTMSDAETETYPFTLPAMSPRTK